ncbi:hypothetical protein F511_33724 [Dorcoceras hygrometricum]|uniref:Dystroglycan-like n=1 Tax=Dorcoceras hygrometricum TaxID=472368 RepID=A0A2Z7A825_9LAMI|nr:hypothetical protein F511_33724 [Dorcoceras hygrometricum]
MASSLISSSLHIDFDSVFGIDDAGLVQMFESFIAMGLKDFLGCPAVFYEAALTEFFENGLVGDGMVVSTIGGTLVEISEEIFAAAFVLPTEALTDLLEVPKYLVFDARRLFFESKEQVRISCHKREMKIEYRLLRDILAKTIYVKAGSFDAVTCERFLLMTAITFDVKVNWSRLLFDVMKDMVTPGSRQAKGYAIQICVLFKNVQGLEFGESKAFPTPRILTEKTIHRYVVINEKVGAEEVVDAPKVKKAPKAKAASKKRPADVVATEPVAKKKRATKKKSGLENVPVAQEAVPIQIIEPFKKLPTIKVEDISEKEDQVLYWGETDSTRVALNRKVYILLKYRELLVRKFLELWKLNFVPGEGTSATDLKVIDMLSDLHLFLLEELKQQTLAHDLRGDRACCSQLFEGRLCTRGAVMTLPDFELIFTVFVSSIASERTVLRNVQIAQDSAAVVPSVQLLDQCPFSSSCSDDSMHFDAHDTVTTSFSLPATATPDVTEALAQLRASIEQIKGRDDGDKLQDTLLLHLHDIEKKFTARFDEQDRVLRALRKDSHDQKHLLSLDIKSSQKQLSAQAATAAIDVVDVRREVKVLNAKVTYLDEQVAATRNDLLEFRATAQETLNHITDQLSELVNYINWGGNDKKGEDSSSRGPQPLPDDQGRPGGGNASRGSGSGGDGRRRGDSGRSSKRRRSGESPPRNVRYGPYPPTGVPKRSAEHWVLGKKDF